jgi:hypothetical protein
MEEKDVYSELSSIRNLMERSSKFISLSGLSGVLAGIYALAGSWLAFRIIYAGSGSYELSDDGYDKVRENWQSLVLIGAGMLLLSLISCVALTVRQANAKGDSLWNNGSKRLISAEATPLLTGGLFILVLIRRGEVDIVLPACLLFYGIALICGSHYTFTDIKWLGLCEIVLGLLAAMFPGYGLFFWAAGFGVLHILYGAIMHFKYDR